MAATCVFLGSDESAAFNSHDFEVTHGMTVRKEARSTYLSRPSSRKRVNPLNVRDERGAIATTATRGCRPPAFADRTPDGWMEVRLPYP